MTRLYSVAHMDLVARVQQALSNQSVHPAEFERCICALLRPRYPGLSAVEGGRNFGCDDIYFPLGYGNKSGSGWLLVTTGDPASNLRTALRRMREKRVTVDLVVIACLGPVTTRARTTLDDICAEYELEPPHVYDRDWLVGALIREPVWRQRLLEVVDEVTLIDLTSEWMNLAGFAPNYADRQNKDGNNKKG